MSFFEGKDANNNSILHITNGVTPKESMRSGVLANTVFHSDLPYLELSDAYEFTIRRNITVYYQVSSQCFGYTIGNGTLYEAPINFINDLGNKSYFLTYDDISPNIGLIGTGDYSWISNVPGEVNTTFDISRPTVSRKYLVPTETFYTNGSNKISVNNCITSPRYYTEAAARPTTVKAYIIKNMHMDGTINSPAFTNNEIKSGNSQLIVKGIDLSTYKFISSEKVNSDDIIISMNSSGTFSDKAVIQIVNSTPSSAGMLISSNPAESKIVKGNKTIFSSLYKPYIYKQNTKYINAPAITTYLSWSCITAGQTPACSGSNLNTINQIIDTGYIDGELFSFNMSTYFWGSTPQALNTRLMRYKSGLIYQTMYYGSRCAEQMGGEARCMFECQCIVRLLGDSLGNLILYCTVCIVGFPVGMCWQGWDGSLTTHYYPFNMNIRRFS